MVIVRCVMLSNIMYIEVTNNLSLSLGLCLYFIDQEIYTVEVLRTNKFIIRSNLCIEPNLSLFIFIYKNFRPSQFPFLIFHD